MEEFNLNNVIGETFEDLSISEMVRVQGSGDVTPETTVICSLSATLASGIELVRTIKGHC